MMPPARLLQKSINWPQRRAKKARFCWWRGMRTTPKYRASWAMRPAGAGFCRSGGAAEFAARAFATRIHHVVAQTTFPVESWESCKAFLKKECTKAEIFDTICNATWARQQEAEDLSQKCDRMVVIGGHHSSNTQKLLQVAARHTTAINVETADELDPAWLAGAETVGVTAGASTPSSIIEEVLNSMSEEIRDDMSFAEMLDASEAKPLYAGKIVKAKVISVSPDGMCRRHRWFQAHRRCDAARDEP